MNLGILNGDCREAGFRGPIQVIAIIGDNSQTFTHDSSDEGNIWGTLGFDFTADNQSMTIILEGLSGIHYIGLDNVSVAPVPLTADGGPDQTVCYEYCDSAMLDAGKSYNINIDGLVKSPEIGNFRILHSIISVGYGIEI